MRRNTTMLSWTFPLVLAAAAAAGDDSRSAMPAYRVETAGFNNSAADIRAVCDSAGGELWRFFSDYEIEPFVVVRGRNGPIVLYDRNGRGEIVMRLDTGNTLWSQYSYQFAHEFCHVLCGYREGPQANKWFEETLCETASVFVIRAMARTWKNDPPYPHWKDYRDSLRGYADDVIRKHDKVHEIYRDGLGEFYRSHREELREHPCLRELNGAMAIVMLKLFEEDPQRWEAVRWLNHEPPPAAETFAAYLQRWRDAVPPKHKPFVALVAGLYGVEITVETATQ